MMTVSMKAAELAVDRLSRHIHGAAADWTARKVQRLDGGCSMLMLT